MKWLGETKAIIKFAIPLALGNLGFVLIQLTDALMTSGLGTVEFAAVGLGGHIASVVILFNNGLVLALAPYIARSLGQNPGDTQNIRAIVQQGIWLAVIVSVPTALCLWDIGWLLELTDQDSRIRPLSTTYLKVFLFSIPPLIVYFALAAVATALNHPKLVMIIALASAGVNFLGNYALIFGHFGLPAMGVVGAALASIIATTFQASAVAVFLFREKSLKKYAFFRGFKGPSAKLMGELARLGFPIGLILLVEVAFFTVTAFIVGGYGAEALAAHQVAIQIVTLTLMISLAVSQTATVRVGLAFGASDAEEIRLRGYVAIALITAIMAVVALTIWLTNQSIVGFFMPLDSAAAQLAMEFLIIAAFFQIVDGLQTVTAGALRGLHDTKVPLAFATVGYLMIGIPLAIIVSDALGQGAIGVWFGMAGGLSVLAFLLIPRFMTFAVAP